MNGRRFPRDQWKALVASQKSPAGQNGETTKDETADEAEHQDSPVNRALVLLRRYRRGWLAACLLILVVCLVLVYSPGANTRTVRVTGRVLIDGKPLTHGTVRFIPLGAPASTGKIEDRGRFTLTCSDGSEGAVLGTHRVEVAATETLNDMSIRWYAPEKYANFQTSGLVFEITGPTHDLLIELDHEDQPERIPQQKTGNETSY